MLLFHPAGRNTYDEEGDDDGVNDGVDDDVDADVVVDVDDGVLVNIYISMPYLENSLTEITKKTMTTTNKNKTKRKKITMEK